jgi:hypothetical protein
MQKSLYVKENCSVRKPFTPDDSGLEKWHNLARIPSVSGNTLGL